MKNLKVQFDPKEIEALSEKCGIHVGHMWGFMELVLNESDVREEVLRMQELRRTFNVQEDHMEEGHPV